MIGSLLLEIDTKVKQLVIKRDTSLQLSKKLKLDLNSLEDDNVQLDRAFIIYDYYLKRNPSDQITKS